MNIVSSSFLDKLISRQRPLWVTLVIGMTLLLAPVGATIPGGSWREALELGSWRPLLLPPVIILYILVLSPLATRSNTEVLKAIRPLVLIDDDQFDRLVREALHINPVGEAAAIGLGVVVGFLSSRAWLQNGDSFWLGLYVAVFLCLMYALLAWVIYQSFVATRLTTQLHRQPLQVEILDPRPFQPIGRQSLLLALLFIGGIVLSMALGWILTISCSGKPGWLICQ